MSSQTVAEFESLWEAAGRRVGPALDDAGAVVVLGHDPIATACAALGMARAQAERRRVAVGDLIGDVAPLRALVTDDDPHGLTDAFLYGVSLSKIARQIDTIGNLHVLPSGSDQVVQEEILQNDRWRRLASGFREAGALLLIAAPAAVPGIEELIRMFDGVALVGDASSPVPGARVFAEVRGATRRPTPPQRIVRPPEAPAAPARSWRWAIPVAAAVLIAAGALLGRNRLAQREEPTPTLRRDSAAASDSFVSSTPPPVESSLPLTAANPGDSARASQYAVQIAMVDTEDGAALRVRRGGGDFPVGTYAPVSRGSGLGTWYKVVTGAYVDRSRAEALLAFLRQRGHLPQGWGSVVRAPLALQVAAAPDTAAAVAVIAELQSRHVPVYGLRQPDGSVRVYVGAFETPEEATLFKSALDSVNIDATLVYRVGRAF